MLCLKVLKIFSVILIILIAYIKKSIFSYYDVVELETFLYITKIEYICGFQNHRNIGENYVFFKHKNW